MKTLVKLKSGQEFEGFIPLKEQIKCFFRFQKMSINKVLWRKLDTKEVYYCDIGNSVLIPIKCREAHEGEKHGKK